MKTRVLVLFLVFHTLACIAQESKTHQEKGTTLSKISNEVCVCYHEISDRSEDHVDKLLIRECLEEATERNLDQIMEYYGIASFKELNLKKYLEDLRPGMIESCKLSGTFIDESFKTITTE